MSSELNPQQLIAVQSSDGQMAIIAGPGTGKTLSFAHRISYLLKEKKVKGGQILTVTFTRSAAREMRERLKRLLENSSDKTELNQIWIDTFHAVALRILSEQNYPWGEGIELSIINEEEKYVLLKEWMSAKEIPEFLEKVRTQKQRLRIPQDEKSMEYQKRLLHLKKLDFDDLFIYVIQLFNEKPEVRSHYQKKFSYLLVDEFQDTSFAQYQFLKQLATDNLTVLGDPDQAIFSFTNDNFNPLEQFKRDFPSAPFHLLWQNYRTQSTILQAAKEVIEKNFTSLPRELSAKLEQGLPIEILSFQTDAQESEMVVKKIENFLGGTSYFSIDSQWAEKEEECYQYGLNEIAVLYRFHAQAHPIKKVLERAGIPYRVYAKKAKENEEVPLSAELEDFQNDEKGLEGEGVTLMTLHRSKGLEFPVVFIVGCEDGILPAKSYVPNKIPSPSRGEDVGEGKGWVEEERRLFYVGMTRAKNRLFLSYAKKRFLLGKRMENKPSRFISEFQEELRKLQQEDILRKKPDPRKTQLHLFE